ncbi:MAG: aspartate kinase [Elusimicrobiales bacterium]|jgi:aspartate kinase
MKIIVMKFGGSSLAEPEKIKIMAERTASARRRGFAVAMVVSAPADLTDDLLTLSKLLTDNPGRREQDALLAAGEQISAALTAMALAGQGAQAVSLSGAQAGIRTDARHTDAEILAVRPRRVLKELRKGRIAVVAGFQGVTTSGDLTTLGRGGSDLTAVALTRALKAGVCELYTDVQGIYTANPAVVPRAKKLRRISYDSVMELARSGTEVRQFRAVAYAKKHSIPLRLRSSFESDEGTLVGDFGAVRARSEVICFSIRKSGDSAELHLIGAGLDAPRVREAVRAAAAAGGDPLRKESYLPGKAVIVTAFRHGEPLLKALHRIFIECH